MMIVGDIVVDSSSSNNLKHNLENLGSDSATGDMQNCGVEMIWNDVAFRSWMGETATVKGVENGVVKEDIEINR